MKCHYCGAELEAGTLYCLCCGTKQLPPEQPEEPALPPLPEPEPEQELPPFPELLPEPEEEPIPEPVPEPEYREVPRPEPVYETPPQRQWAPAKPLPTISAPRPPRIQLPTRRSLVKMILLGLLTLGIYPLVIWSRMATELNITASRYDGERTRPFFAMLPLWVLTLGIYGFVWNHGFCRRVGQELRRRRLDFTFDVADYWLWGILGALILVGPFVYTFKIMRAMNQINEDFNRNG